MADACLGFLRGLEADIDPVSGRVLQAEGFHMTAARDVKTSVEECPLSEPLRPLSPPPEAQQGPAGQPH